MNYWYRFCSRILVGGFLIQLVTTTVDATFQGPWVQPQQQTGTWCGTQSTTSTSQQYNKHFKTRRNYDMTHIMSCSADSYNGQTEGASYCDKMSEVWYDLSTIGSYQYMKNQPMSINVRCGDCVGTLQEKIKEYNPDLFKNVDAPSILLYKSSQSTVPLDSNLQWNTTVLWGTDQIPLIVQVEHYYFKRQGRVFNAIALIISGDKYYHLNKLACLLLYQNCSLCSGVF
jgi:hypothetical protein